MSMTKLDFRNAFSDAFKKARLPEITGASNLASFENSEKASRQFREYLQSNQSPSYEVPLGLAVLAGMGKKTSRRGFIKTTGLSLAAIGVFGPVGKAFASRRNKHNSYWKPEISWHDRRYNWNVYGYGHWNRKSSVSLGKLAKTLGELFPGQEAPKLSFKAMEFVDPRKKGALLFIGFDENDHNPDSYVTVSAQWDERENRLSPNFEVRSRPFANYPNHPDRDTVYVVQFRQKEFNFNFPDEFIFQRGYALNNGEKFKLGPDDARVDLMGLQLAGVLEALDTQILPVKNRLEYFTLSSEEDAIYARMISNAGTGVDVSSLRLENGKVSAVMTLKGVMSADGYEMIMPDYVANNLNIEKLDPNPDSKSFKVFRDHVFNTPEWKNFFMDWLGYAPEGLSPKVKQNYEASYREEEEKLKDLAIVPFIALIKDVHAHITNNPSVCHNVAINFTSPNGREEIMSLPYPTPPEARGEKRQGPTYDKK